MKAKHTSGTSIAGTLALVLMATFLGMMVSSAAGPGTASTGLRQGDSPSDATGLLDGLEQAVSEKVDAFEYTVVQGLGHLEYVCIGRHAPRSL